jgi:hypothetical protein
MTGVRRWRAFGWLVAAAVLLVAAASAQARVRASSVSGSGAVQEAELTSIDGYADDTFGTAVAASGGTIVVGAPEKQIGSHTFEGAAYVFTQSAGGAWQQTAELTPADGAAGWGFGSVVAVSGSTILVSAPTHNLVYVFSDSTGSWQQVAELTPMDAASGDYFGDALAISGGTFVAGAPDHEVQFTARQGAAYVYSDGSGSWQQTAELTAPDGASGDLFGGSVAVAGTEAAVGAQDHATSTTAQGAVYLFSDASGPWTGPTELVAGDAAANDLFGTSVAISGSTLAAGAENKNSGRGAVYVFTNGAGGWAQNAELTATDGAAQDELGASLAISGSTVVAGAPGHAVGSNETQGAVYAFDQPSGGQWQDATQTELSLAGGRAQDRFGSSVADSGTDILGGSFFHRVGAYPDQGAVGVYDDSATPLPVNTAAPSISGGTTVGDTLSVTPGTWVNGPVTDGYQWFRCDGSAVNCAPIAGATGTSYDLQAADVGYTFRVQDTASNSAGTGSPATSNATAAATPPAPVLVPGSAPQISGTPAVAQTLTESNASWTNHPTSFKYQWFDCTPGAPCTCPSASCSAIANATNQSYVVQQSDVGDEIVVREIAVNAGGESAPAYSSPTSAATQLQPPVPTCPPTVLGIFNPGQVLTESHGCYQNGIDLSYVYQWQRCSTSATSSCSDISGATSQTYTPTSDDAGDWIAVVETASNPAGPAPANPSAPAGPVVIPPAPVDTGALPSIVGTDTAGQTLVETHGGWSNNPYSYRYQWEDCNPAPTDCTPISGATGQAYTLQGTDVGDTIEVEEWATNAGGTGGPATSAPTNVVAASVPMNLQKPTISGPAVAGQTLLETNGVWSPAPTSYAYQWQDCDAYGNGCVDITGATGQTYALTASDVGHTIVVVETAKNAAGMASAKSAQTNPVLPQGPVNIVPPTISGTPRPGATLVESHGSWTNSPIAFVYQWEDCDLHGGTCVGIAGATNQTYTVAATDIGHTIEVQETAANVGGESSPVNSQPTTVVVSAPSVTVPGRQGLNAAGSASLSGTVDPDGLATTAFYEYGLDPQYTSGGSIQYTDTPSGTVGSDFAAYHVTATVTGLVPNAVYHVRLVATNSAGTTTGPDQTFRTAATTAGAPVAGQAVDLTVLSGVIMVRPPGGTLSATDSALPRQDLRHGFEPLTETRRIPVGSEIDARAGKLKLVAATRHHTRQTVTLAGAIFTIAQTRTGLTTATLLEGAYPGSPTYASCRSTSSRRVLQTLTVDAPSARFGTHGRHSTTTGSHASWRITDQCNGTLTRALRGTVSITLPHGATTVLHEGGTYLAKRG